MDASNAINLGILIVTAIGAIYTGVTLMQTRQARADAKTAAHDASQHEQKALKAAEDAAAAAGKSATSLADLAAATKRHTDLQERLAAPKNSWDIESLGGAHLKWHVTNRTGNAVPAVLDIVQDGPGNIVQVDPLTTLVEPGRTLEFKWIRNSNSANYIVLNVRWEEFQQGWRTETQTVRWPS